MTELMDADEIRINLPTSILTYFENGHAIRAKNTQHLHQDFSNDFALHKYLIDPKNTYEQIIKTDTSNIIENPLPNFFSNVNAFCQVDSILLIQTPNDCHGLAVEELNDLYQKARALGKAENMVAAINLYNEILNLIPADNTYYNPLFKQIYWHLGSSHLFLRNLDQAKRCFELAIALATDNKNLGMIYSKIGLILNMQGQHERAHIAHKKAVKLMPNNKDALKLLETTEQAISQQPANSNSRAAFRI